MVTQSGPYSGCSVSTVSKEVLTMMLLLISMLRADQGHESSSYWVKGRKHTLKRLPSHHRTHRLLNQEEGKIETFAPVFVQYCIKLLEPLKLCIFTELW